MTTDKRLPNEQLVATPGEEALGIAFATMITAKDRIEIFLAICKEGFAELTLSYFTAAVNVEITQRKSIH